MLWFAEPTLTNIPANSTAEIVMRRTMRHSVGHYAPFQVHFVSDGDSTITLFGSKVKELERSILSFLRH